MKREKMHVFTNVSELMNVVQEKAVQLEEMAKMLEGNYEYRNESNMPEYCGTIKSNVSYIGLEYNEKYGIRAVAKFQDIFTYDIADKRTGRNTYTSKCGLEELQKIVAKYKRV